MADRRFYFGAWAAITALYLLMATANALTKAPWWDEGLFADPASNLAFRGYLGASLQEPTGRPGGMFLRDVGKYTFWNMPLYMVALAGWFKIFGFSIVSMRSMSILWGLILLISWFFIVKSLSQNKGLALLTVAVLALDYTVLISCSNGRPDCMTVALGSAAIAVYLSLREHSLSLAIACGTSLTAAATFTHPLGLISLTGLVFVALYFDHRKLRLIHLPLAGIPYAVAIFVWGLYIIQAPDVFFSQFSNSVGYRTRSLFSPLRSILTDITQRYFHYFFSTAQLQGLTRLKGLVLVGYTTALLGAALTPEIRRHPAGRVPLWMTALYFVTLALLDTEKNPHYFVHVFPLLAVVLATWVWWLWTRTRVPPQLIGIGLAGLVTLQIIGIAYKVRLNSYQNVYLPAVQYVTDHYKKGDLVMGGAELAFALPASVHLIDDASLGFHSGRVPDLIVCNFFYPDPERQARRNNGLRIYLDALFEHYQLGLANREFKVYARSEN
jgi:4-amino-4-deoxy-L-arabinose transferase-like glycosyltransferase